ncbi:hypothetical protein [Magnetospirillum molischianum]|uniref:Uncharacterized protein n=1 Tax=Magnetospirillum molischianum DSM 120 TaxID=1150626 RepID=H8FP92_MAGML|nr:hypothetical protein [Magnetospirillum molischianum]CCG40180.1 conserved hypothetical protein [Magnetospirillum molischianum DSM 120]
MIHTDSNQLDIDREEIYFCPHCGRRTRHSVTRERVLVPVLWCLSCFHTHMGESEEPPQISTAETSSSSRLAGSQAGA